MILRILCIAFLCFPSICFGDACMVGEESLIPSGAGVTCSGDFSDGDNESFEAASDGSVCLTDFTQETDTNSILTTNSTTQANTGSKAIEIAGTAINQAAFVSYDAGAIDGDFSIRFYIRTPSDLSTLSTSQPFRILDGNVSGIQSSTRLSLNMYNYGISAYSSDTSSSISLSDGTWYRVEVDYNQNDTSTLYVYNIAGTLVDSATFTARDNALRYWDFGQCNNNVTDYSTYYLDDLKFQAAGGTVGAE